MYKHVLKLVEPPDVYMVNIFSRTFWKPDQYIKAAKPDFGLVLCKTSVLMDSMP